MCFEQHSFEPQEVTRRAHIQCMEYVEGRRTEMGDMERQRDQRWKPPDHGTYKITVMLLLNRMER